MGNKTSSSNRVAAFSDAEDTSLAAKHDVVLIQPEGGAAAGALETAYVLTWDETSVTVRYRDLKEIVDGAAVPVEETLPKDDKRLLFKLIVQMGSASLPATAMAGALDNGKPLELYVMFDGYPDDAAEWLGVWSPRIISGLPKFCAPDTTRAARGAGDDGLPDGWAYGESKSRPGTLVYENVYTKEHIDWVPLRPASRIDHQSFDLKPWKNLPEGWRCQDDLSKDNYLVYENMYSMETTKERPTKPARPPSRATEARSRRFSSSRRCRSTMRSRQTRISSARNGFET